MHKFLKPIGFTKIEKKELDQIIKDIIDHPQIIKVAKDSEGNEFAELSREFAQNIGITVRGTYEEDESFRYEYYYPYFIGTNITTEEQIEIEKHAEKESYAGICDEIRLGVTLIFYLQNVTDYLSEINRQGKLNHLHGTILSGLASDAKILLPIENKKNHRIDKSYENNARRNQLIAQARDGDEDAIESLTMEDMDMYTILSKRVMREDIFSIVNSYFMPYGIESDQYSILGEILDYTSEENNYTNEIIYCIKVNCNNMVFDICINQQDLMGEPEIGRRIKANLWMQGSICLH